MKETLANISVGCQSKVPSIMIRNADITSEPKSRVLMSPAQGPQESKIVLRIAVPREAVKIAFRNPSRPRVGILYLSRLVPSDLPKKQRNHQTECYVNLTVKDLLNCRINLIQTVNLMLIEIMIYKIKVLNFDKIQAHKLQTMNP